jgi:hypothetical protein
MAEPNEVFDHQLSLKKLGIKITVSLQADVIRMKHMLRNRRNLD